jgi:CheY-like chemotaxis protein
MTTTAVLPEATPALICSLPAEQDAANALGADGYLIKPIAREALLASLERLNVMKGTVLIVDDETEAVRLFWRMLTSSGRGYRVLTANNGQQALSILRQERPDVVLLDLTMPGMDGFQVLNLRPREEWRDVPFIVVSARDPAGHPVVTNALCVMRSGGLSLAQILRYIEVMSGPLGEEPPAQPERPVLPEA